MLRVNLFSVSVYNNALLLIVVLLSCPVWSSNCLTGTAVASQHSVSTKPLDCCRKALPHWCWVLQKYTSFENISSVKKKFPHSFSLLFPLSFLSTTQWGGGGICAVRARWDVGHSRPFALETARPLNGLQHYCFCAVPLRRATDAVTWLLCALVNSYVCGQGG